MLFFLEYMQSEAPRFLFSSATPDPTFLRMMNRAGIKFHEVRGTYSSADGDELRHILHPSSLTLHKLQDDEITEIWLQKNLDIIIKHWQQASRKQKGVIILNSVVAVAGLHTCLLFSFDLMILKLVRLRDLWIASKGIRL